MKDNYPGMESIEDYQKTLKSLEDSIIPSRHSGRFRSADLWEQTLNAFLQNPPKFD